MARNNIAELVEYGFLRYLCELCFLVKQKGREDHMTGSFILAMEPSQRRICRNVSHSQLILQYLDIQLHLLSYTQF